MTSESRRIALWPTLILISALATGCSLSTPTGTETTIGVATTKTSSAPAAPTLSPSDFAIKFRVKSKQCFGSAGCNLVLAPELTLLRGSVKDRKYEVTFRVHGDENGPVVQTMTVTGEEISYDEIDISTSGSSVKIYGEVTDVEQWPY